MGRSSQHRRPPVLAYHLIWTGYGWWLPNDPRGSGSHVIRNDVLHDLGELHYSRKRVQPARRVVREFYDEAHDRLTFPVLSFDDSQIAIVAESFADVIAEQSYTCYACAIMPDHVHLLIRKHRDRAEQMIARLQGKSALRLIETPGIDPKHPIWTAGGWRVFLDSPDDIRRTIRYIERNPRSPQSWPFVTPYDGWPFHNRAKC